MKGSRVLRMGCGLALFVAMIFWGCGTSQDPSSIQNGTRLPSEVEATNDDSINSAVITDTASEQDAPFNEVAEPHSSPAENTDPVLVLIEDEISTLDPYQMVTIHPDGSIASHIWDTLTLLNDDLQIEPHVAESWRLINNLTWEIELREDITFHNGELLNAQAVKFSIDRSRSMPGSLETFANDIDLDEVEIVDDYTVRFVTHQPVINLPFHLAFLEILPPVHYSENNLDHLAISPVGSGPYQLVDKEWTPGDSLAMEAVPDYWKGAPAFHNLVFQTISVPEERLAALRLGEADLVADLPPIRPDDWRSSGSSIEIVESTQRLFVGIPIGEESPLANKDVRQALNYGVNVEKIVDEWFEGYGERYGSWVNPPSINLELQPWPYDPDLAREMLAEAGYQDGITVTLRTPVGVYKHDVDVAQAIAQQLEEVGVAVEVEKFSNWGVYIRELLTGKSDSLFLLKLNSRGDGLEDANNLSAAFAFNPTRWQKNEFEDLLGRARATFNDNSRIRLLNEVQEIGYEEATWIWLWRPYHFYGVREGLEWTPRRDGLINLYKTEGAPTESVE